jgi:D-serine deaminase-like pyridoxal phosphate-dependent protein
VRHGIECPTVTGAGAFEFEAASGVYTEFQCGSYICMDADYVMGRPTDDRAIVTALFLDSGLLALLGRGGRGRPLKAEF